MTEKNICNSENKDYDIESLIVEMQEVNLDDSLDSSLKLKSNSGLLLIIDGKIRKFISRVVSCIYKLLI